MARYHAVPLENTVHSRQSELTVVLLAGGQSSRMGSDKTQLDFQGQPLWRHMLFLLHEGGFDDVLVSGPEGIADIAPGKGPLSGLHACLHAIPAHSHRHGILLLPVDMPLLTPDLLIHLGREGHNRKIPLHYEDFQLPLYLPLAQALRNYTETIVREVDKRHYSLRRLITHLHGSTIPVSEGQGWRFRNANTPEDWRRCLADA